MEACPKCGGITGVRAARDDRYMEFYSWGGETDGAQFERVIRDCKTGRCEDCGFRVRLEHLSTGEPGE